MTDHPDIVWGAEAIGRLIGRNRRQVYHIADRGLLRSIRRVGNLLCASQSALLAEVSGASTNVGDEARP